MIKGMQSDTYFINKYNDRSKLAGKGEKGFG